MKEKAQHIDDEITRTTFLNPAVQTYSNFQTMKLSKVLHNKSFRATQRRIDNLSSPFAADECPSSQKKPPTAEPSEVAGLYLSVTPKPSQRNVDWINDENHKHRNTTDTELKRTNRKEQSFRPSLPTLPLTMTAPTRYHSPPHFLSSATTPRTE